MQARPHSMALRGVCVDQTRQFRCTRLTTVLRSHSGQERARQPFMIELCWPAAQYAPNSQGVLSWGITLLAIGVAQPSNGTITPCQDQISCCAKRRRSPWH